MDASTFKEIGSFAAVIVPVMLAFIWGGKVLLNWFTQTIGKQQEQLDKLLTELTGIVRETQTAHAGMMQLMAEISKALNEAHGQRAQEHEKIIECIEAVASKG